MKEKVDRYHGILYHFSPRKLFDIKESPEFRFILKHFVDKYAIDSHPITIPSFDFTSFISVISGVTEVLKLVC